MTNKEFRRRIWAYYKKHGRDLPWRRTKNPYHILVSEVMLQQTQVARVILKYREFVKTFPTFGALAGAPKPEVLRAWQGLGYNRRALYLKRACEIVVEKHAGKLPKNRAELEALPGVGAATAGAVLAFAYGLPTAFIETNIRRVYLHFFFPGREHVYDREVLELVEKTMDKKRIREWYWALMDYGVMLAQGENANKRSAHYARQSRFHGSLREARGRAIRLLLNGPRRKTVAQKELGVWGERALAALLKEGIVEEKRGVLMLVR